MRKFKSILAVTLSAALAVSATLTTMTASAFAEEPEIAEPAPAVQELEPAAAKEESPAPVEEKAEEKPAEDIPAAEEEIPAEPPETPEISSDEVKEILGSEEVKNALEEAGLDEDEIGEVTDDPNTRIIYITQEEYEEMRREDALAGFLYPVEELSIAVGGIIMILTSPISLILPIIGPAVGIIVVAGTIPITAKAFVAGIGLGIASPVIVLVRYINFELPDNYVVVK